MRVPNGYYKEVLGVLKLLPCIEGLKIALLLAIFLALISCGGKSGVGSSTPPPTTTPSPFVTLTWEAPNERVNGDCLDETEIGGFILNYGEQAIAEYQEYIVYNLASCSVQGNGSNSCGQLLTCSYQVVGVTRGYFVLRAYDVNNEISGYSNTVWKE